MAIAFKYSTEAEPSDETCICLEDDVERDLIFQNNESGL